MSKKPVAGHVNLETEGIEMRHRVRSLSPWLCAWTLMLGTASADAGLLNGSFEDGAFVADGNGAMSLFPGDTSITGWTVSTSELAWITTPNNFSLVASDGVFSLDLAGYDDAAPYGGVEQSVTTTIGNEYLLTFDLGTFGTGTIASILVTAGGTSDTLSATATIAGTEWHAQSFSFVATSTNTLLSLVGTTASGNGIYIGLDNLLLTDQGPAQAVPEPASLTLLGLGTIALIGAARRRRQAV